MIKLFSYCFTYLFLSTQLLAQPPIVSRPRLFGGTNSDVFHAVVPTFDGGSIAVGSTWSDDYDATGSHGASDFFVVKLGSGEDIQWKKTYGGASTEEAFAIRQTLDSGYLIAGNTSSNNSGDVGISKGNADAWVIKVDKQGNIVWQRNYGGSKGDGFSDLALTDDGGFIAVGKTSSRDGDITNYHGAGLSDGWVVRCNADGTIRWQKTYGGIDLDVIIKIAKIGVDWITVGWTDSRDGDVGQPKGGYDGWALRISDTDGTIVWKQNYGVGGFDRFLSVKTYRKGNNDVAIVAGSGSSLNDDVLNEHNSFDGWLLRLNGLTGEPIWSRLFGGTQYEQFNDVIYDETKDSYLAVGYTDSSDGDATKSYGTIGGFDAWFVRIKTTGAFEAAYSLGTTKPDFVYSVYKKTSAFEGYVGVGTMSIADGYFSGILYRGNGDAAIYRPITITRTQEVVEQIPLSITPNPADASVSFDLGRYPSVKAIDKILFDGFTITNVIGKVLVSQKIDSYPVTLETKNWANGIYFLRLEKNGQSIVVRKWVVQHGR